MLKQKNIIISITTVFLFGVFLNYNSEHNKDYNSVRELHKKNLKKSPFNSTKKLNKKERKKLQIPPNAYNDRLWELTMDPVLGRPSTENLFLIVCGPTLYNNPHIGNFRPIVIFDILFRLLQNIYDENKVIYVRNITDIDDKR